MKSISKLIWMVKSDVRTQKRNYLPYSGKNILIYATSRQIILFNIDKEAWRQKKINSEPPPQIVLMKIKIETYTIVYHHTYLVHFSCTEGG